MIVNERNMSTATTNHCFIWGVGIVMFTLRKWNFQDCVCVSFNREFWVKLKVLRLNLNWWFTKLLRSKTNLWSFETLTFKSLKMVIIKCFTLNIYISQRSNRSFRSIFHSIYRRRLFTDSEINCEQLRLITSNNHLCNHIAKRSLSNPVLSNYSSWIPRRTSGFTFKAIQLIAAARKKSLKIFSLHIKMISLS